MSAPIAQPKPWVTRLTTYEAGRPIEEVAREQGIDPSDILKLASNENPIGPSPLAIESMRRLADQMHLYPDGDAHALRLAIAHAHGVDARQVFVGHGSNEIIALLGHVYLGPGTSIIAADRAFVVYRLVAALYQADVCAVPMRAYTHDLDAMRASMDDRTRIVFIANPNNPTGTMVDGAALDAFIDSLPPDVLVVVDEAYIELIPEERQPDLLKHVRAGRPVVILRTFSKAHGLAGLRIGYALAPESVVALLHRVRQPFNVNAMALAAARAALADRAHQERTRALVQAGLRQIEAGLTRAGIPFVPSVANFLLVEVGAGRAIFDALRRKGIIVRPMDPYGLPAHIRVTVGTADQNERFLHALDQVRKEQVKS